MTYKPELIDNLPDTLGLTAERATELNKVFENSFRTDPEPTSAADIIAFCAPHIITPEECFYIGYHIGAATTIDQ